MVKNAYYDEDRRNIACSIVFNKANITLCRADKKANWDFIPTFDSMSMLSMFFNAIFAYS